MSEWWWEQMDEESQLGIPSKLFFILFSYEKEGLSLAASLLVASPL